MPSLFHLRAAWVCVPEKLSVSFMQILFSPRTDFAQAGAAAATLPAACGFARCDGCHHDLPPLRTCSPHHARTAFHLPVAFAPHYRVLCLPANSLLPPYPTTRSPSWQFNYHRRTLLIHYSLPPWFLLPFSTTTRTSPFLVPHITPLPACRRIYKPTTCTARVLAARARVLRVLRFGLG